MEIIASKQSLAETTQQEAWDPRSQVVPVWWYGIGMAVKEKDVDTLDYVLGCLHSSYSKFIL